MKSLSKRKAQEETHPKKSKTKFSGPLTILVIEPKKDYLKTILCAICMGLTNVMIGAVCIGLLIYSISSGDSHAAVSTFAYQFFCMEAVLSLNYANGWSTPMRLKHRKLVHVLLQICAMICAFAGFVFALKDYGTPKTGHGIAGTVAGASSIISLLSGPGSLLGGRYQKIVHICLGMITLTASALCFCLGLVTDAFNNWSATIIRYMLMGFVIFYTIFIVVTVFTKCFTKV